MVKTTRVSSFFCLWFSSVKYYIVCKFDKPICDIISVFFWHFYITLLSEQRLQMEKVWIEYLLRDTIVERGEGGPGPLSHKMFPFSNLQFTLSHHCLSFPQNAISPNIVENIVVKERKPPLSPSKYLQAILVRHWIYIV